MTDDANAPTVPDTQGPTHGAIATGAPKAPDSRYALKTLLGKGGMGEVWLAHDERIDRDIAIKMMRSGAGNADAVARFLREARVQGRLEHPSVVPVHDLGRDDAAPFFAMKRLAGTTLADVLSSADHTRWSRRTLLARFVDVCLAVEFAHQRGVVHRDLKPANIMLGDFGEAYVLDWGLARLDGDKDNTVVRPSDASDSTPGQTEAGAMLGTPGYMAPEQMRGEAIDHRVDVYALGCILYELLAGAPAMARARVLELTLTAPCHRPTSAGHDVPPELDDLCAQATMADPAARLASARTLADSVQRFLDGDRDLERRRELAAKHVARAQELFEKSDEESRGEAMREAGSAIALDATSRDAQAILARLLLDPPKAMPADAAKKIEEDRQSAARTVMRGATFAYACFLIPMVVVWWLGVSQLWPLLLLGGEVLALMAFCMAGARGLFPINRLTALASVIGHCVLLMSIGLVVGPLFLLPNLIFGSSTIMVSITAVRMPLQIFGWHVASIAVPLALELAGVMPRTFSFVDNALVLSPRLIEMSPASMLFTILAVVVLQLASNMFVLDAQRRHQDRAQEQVHINAWQLKQLVPSSGSTG